MIFAYNSIVKAEITFAYIGVDWQSSLCWSFVNALVAKQKQICKYITLISISVS